MQTVSIILSIIVVVVLVATVFMTSVLRESSKPDSPYSFSRFQLWIWTAVVSPCFILSWGFHPGKAPALNETALVLLGIAGTVTVFSWTVASARLEKSIKSLGVQLKVNQPSRNFWLDILMDSNGNYSVTRLQQLIFVLIYCVIYVSLFSQARTLPDFDKTAYILMGISSGGYLIGKSVE